MKVSGISIGTRRCNVQKGGYRKTNLVLEKRQVNILEYTVWFITTDLCSYPMNRVLG